VGPVTGQLWSDTSTTPATLKAFNGSIWVPVQAAGSGGIPASLLTATGDMIYASAASTPARLGIGTAGQVLTVSGGVPTWSSLAPGGVTSVTGTAPIASSGGATPAISLTPGTARQLLQTNAGGTAAEFTNNVDIPGTLDVTGVATFDGIASHPLGTAAAPSVTFTGDTDTGFYSPGAGRLGITNNGAAKVEVNATGDILVGGTLPGTPNAQITTAGQVIGTSYNGGQLAGFRNLLINGNFAINQRGYVSGTATAAANQYTLDRWKVLVSGQNLAFAASGNGNQITAPAGGVQQVIEAGNVGGGTYTLSWSGTATAAVNGTAATNGSQVTLPANTQATVTFTGGTVSNAQLEPGTKATPFEQRLIGSELGLCQRYYQQMFIQGRQNLGLFIPFANSVSPTPSNSNGFVWFQNPMRVAPTGSVTIDYSDGSFSGATVSITMGGGGPATNTFGASLVIDRGIYQQGGGNYGTLWFTLYFDAEL
jgi:hypothetical protein